MLPYKGVVLTTRFGEERRSMTRTKFAVLIAFAVPVMISFHAVAAAQEGKHQDFEWTGRMIGLEGKDPKEVETLDARAAKNADDLEAHAILYGHHNARALQAGYATEAWKLE